MISYYTDFMNFNESDRAFPIYDSGAHDRVSHVLRYVHGHANLDSLCVSVRVHVHGYAHDYVYGYAHAYVFCLRVNAYDHVYECVDGCVYVYVCAFLSLL
jgi:hypothetical protein